MKKVLIVSFCLIFSGCGLAVRALEFASPTFEKMQEARRQESDLEQVDEFRQLLDDGWRLYLHEGKMVVLVKDTPDGLLIKDVFGNLNDD